MKSNLKFFKKKKILPIDKFFQNVLYDKKIGYYIDEYEKQNQEIRERLKEKLI